MTMRTALGLTAILLSATPALASTGDILIGLDQKVTYGANGPVNGPPGKDAVAVLNVANPSKPHIRGTLPLMNTLAGPPTNLQITPDGKLGLVANSIVDVQDGAGWKTAPDDKLFVIDLIANPPVLKDTITVGKQPSGLAISHKGDLALIANRAGKSVSVVTIDNGSVKAVGEVPMDQEASSVVITPDGKRAFVTLNLANKVAVLSIDGTNVTYDKTLDIPAAFNPYNIDITPDGKYAIVSGVGTGKNNADTQTVIDAIGPHPHVVDVSCAGLGSEGFAISSNGKWAASPLINGSGAKPSDWFYNKTGELVVMSVGANGKLTVTGKAKLGALPEGIAFSPDGGYIYVGNFIDSDLQVFRVNNGKPVQVGPNIKLPGQPASIRGIAR
jgi:DNA-binding beta-propeller fold protein YncE